MDENTTSDVKQEENLPQENMLGEELPKQPSESLLTKIKTNIHFPTSFFHSALIPGAIIILILLIGGGGTYLVASNVFNKPAETSSVSSISANDIPEVPTVSIPTPTPTLASTNQSIASVNPSAPTPTGVNSAAGWTPYNFGVLYLNFSYPPGWYVFVANTSGAPYLTIQNFSGPTPTIITGAYSIFIGRFEQVGITTVANLTTQLALNAANDTYINGVNVGQVTVVTATPTTINGYQALQRTVTYSSAPSVQRYELYVLDGVSNVVEFVPQLDTTYGQPYFDTLVSTIQFTN